MSSRRRVRNAHPAGLKLTVGDVTTFEPEHDAMLNSLFDSCPPPLAALGLACLLALPLSSFADEVSQPAEEAKSLFEAMERKIVHSPTLRCQLAVTMHRGQARDPSVTTEVEKQPPVDRKDREPPTVTLKGKLLIAGDNRLLLRWDGQIEGRVERIAIVSDGTTLRAVNTTFRTADAGVGKPAGAPSKRLAADTKAALARMGMFIPMFTVVQQSDAPPAATSAEAALPLSKFQWGPRERVAEIDTQVIEYDVSFVAAKASYHVKLWIDSATSLPVKRVVALDAAGQKRSATETYSDFRLGDPVEDREFAINP